MRASKRGQLALPRRSPCRAERGATGVGRWLVGCAGSWPVERAPLRVETVQADLRGKYALLRRVYGPRGVSLREFSANQPLSSAFFVSLGQTRCHRRRFNTLRYRWRGLVAEHYSEASDGQSPSGHPKDSILWDPSLSRRISLKRATKATRKIWSSGTRYPGTLDAARHAEGSSDVQMIWLTMLHPSGQSAAQNGFLGPEKRHQWASTCYASSARSLTGPASPSRCQTRRRGGDRKTIIWNGSPHTAPATNKTAQAGGQPPLPPKNQITHHASVPERSGAGTYPKRLHSRGAIRWKRLVDNACRAGPLFGAAAAGARPVASGTAVPKRQRRRSYYSLYTPPPPLRGAVGTRSREARRLPGHPRRMAFRSSVGRGAGPAVSSEVGVRKRNEPDRRPVSIHRGAGRLEACPHLVVAALGQRRGAQLSG